jgi:hypothetical protein
MNLKDRLERMRAQSSAAKTVWRDGFWRTDGEQAIVFRHEGYSASKAMNVLRDHGVTQDDLDASTMMKIAVGPMPSCLLVLNGPWDFREQHNPST